MRTITKLDRARTKLVLDHPFFASILMRHPLQEDHSIPTFAVTQRGRILYNPTAIEHLSVGQIVWGLAHECGHIMGLHFPRMGKRDRKRWNWAGDAWINDMLAEAKIGEPIPNTVHFPGGYRETVENLYELAPEDWGDGGGGGGGGGNNNGGLVQGPDFIDDPEGPPSESEIREIETRTKIEIAQATQAAKVRGKLPAAIEKIVSEILYVKTPWYEYLEQWCTARTNTEWTWSRPNRRYIGQGIILPSQLSQCQMGELVVQVDISGSISRKEVAYWNGHLSRIVELVRPEKVHLLYVDTRVARHDEFEVGEEPRVEFFTGGGTDMRAGFYFISKQGIEPDAHIVLTDGYTPFPSRVDWPTFWCISSEGINAPAEAGMSVHFEMV